MKNFGWFLAGAAVVGVGVALYSQNQKIKQLDLRIQLLLPEEANPVGFDYPNKEQ